MMKNQKSGKKTDPLITDLHIHSHYSRATSPHLNIEEIYRWGKIKGINILGTGDFTHPIWLSELQKKLEPAEPGLFKLKKKYAKDQDKDIPVSCKDNIIRFVLSVETSNIYPRHGRSRRVHNVVTMPSFESVKVLNDQLAQIGNLMADGRPILKLDSEELLLMSLETHKDSLFIPAHIWTPWYAMFGSKSGFDSLEEAFGENKKYIYAIETGLSSDPYMNWRLDELSNLTITSNSDAHSPQKLAREANLIACKLDYYDIADAIKTNDERFVGTIDFFPEEGKYHLDGHRKCGIRFTPSETKQHKGICPKCGRAITVGVENRVESLSNRPQSKEPRNNKIVEYIIPLVEILAEIKGVKSTTASSVTSTYNKIITRLGSEFNILRKVSIKDIADAGFPELSTAISNMRSGKVNIEPGFDGEYGKISVYGKDFSNTDQDEQLNLW